MHTPGFWNMILILGIAVLLFGGKKLPQLGLSIGEAIKNFKKSVKDAETPTAQQEPKSTQPTAAPTLEKPAQIAATSTTAEAPKTESNPSSPSA